MEINWQDNDCDFCDSIQGECWECREDRHEEELAKRQSE